MRTVDITWFDRLAVTRALEEHVRRLVARHPEVEEVILFGSLAKGTPVPGSDVDLIIILDASEARFIDRIPAFLPDRFPVSMDVFPYTRDEFERMRRQRNTLVRDAIRDGVVMFRRPRTTGRDRSASRAGGDNGSS